jgi:hypothetical protein
LAQRLKQYFSHLPILVLLGGLYLNGPIIQLCRRNNWDFMMVLQDASLTTVWEEFEGLKKLSPSRRQAENAAAPARASACGNLRLSNRERSGIAFFKRSGMSKTDSL